MIKYLYSIIIIIILLLFLYINHIQNNQGLKTKIINFFENLGYTYQSPVPVRSKSYGPKNDYYIYSTEIVQKNNSVMIQPIIRKEDQNSNNPFRLSKFTMISIKSCRDMANTIDICLKFIKDFCKFDIRKIGCVSISGDNLYDFDGIEMYIEQLTKEGISKNNIYIRNADEAVNEGAGDGYWTDPDFSEYNEWSIAFYYQLKNGAKISNYKNYNEWLELSEITDSIIGFGLERIKHIMNITNH